MKTSHAVIAVVATAALVIGGYELRKHYKPKGTPGSGPAPKLISDGKGGSVAYDVAKWHVAAVTSPSGRTAIPGATGPAATFAAGDYVTFVLVYETAPSSAQNPAVVAVGQVTQMGQATPAGKRQGVVRFLQATGQGNAAVTSDLPMPDRETPFSVTSDDVATVVPPDQVPALLGAV